MRDVLNDILAARRGHISAAKKSVPLAELERAIKKVAPVRGFAKAITAGGGIGIIAEMKRQSPSGGLLREPYAPAEIARAYESGGARALSVLTEPDRFKGQLADIGAARSGTKLPIMQKDFVFDPYQIAEARAAGADAILLIADMLEKKELLELAASACEYGVDALVEVFTEGVVDAALETKATLIGVNTRNLRTLEMFPDNVERLGRLVPKDRVLVGESGIKNAADIAKLKKAGARAILVGESLLRQNDLTQATKTLAEACR